MEGFLFVFNLLTDDIREETHESCSLDRKRNATLRLRRYSAPSLGLNTRMRGKEFLESIDVFVVDVVYLMCFEVIFFFHD
jgi:hypothetical protein